MPTSKTYLPDVNVWIALTFDGHVHHQAARRWLNEIEETVAFCRITQMGLLRLVTNRKVMGEAVLTQAQAWSDYDQFQKDPRVIFLNEPADLEDIWRGLTEQQNPKHSWTDAYLLAFAKARDLAIVTFDQALTSVQNPAVIVLGD